MKLRNRRVENKMSTSNVTIIKTPDQMPSASKRVSEERVVDLNNMVGRIKPKPVCVDANLKQEAMCTEEINKFVFVVESEPVNIPNSYKISSSVPAEKPSPTSDLGLQEISVVSSSSSTASRESGTSISHTCGEGGNLQRKDESERFNIKVMTQKISRNGRQTQRWYTDPTTPERRYRMTTGCIPVLKNGRILFCSASRKSEWILPKGGWEMDEEKEESAIRETFEEAGVFGILGPTLQEIEYETRKARKRRIEYETVQRKAKQICEDHSSSPKMISPSRPAVVPLPEDIIGSGTHDQLKNSDGDNCSVASEASLSYTHVKMTLFPLYVTEVRKEWPEHGRLRKIVGIDDAIILTKSRPEFQEALKELKRRNLHKLPQNNIPSTTNNKI